MRKKFLSVLSLLCAVVLLTGTVITADAIGSGQMNVTTDKYRLYSEWAGGTTAGIKRQQIIYTYAFAGETVYFGSSVTASMLDLDGNPTGAVTNNDIVVTGPNGNTVAFDVVNNGAGHVLTYNMAVAGPNMEGSNPEGYLPLSFTAEQDGIYEFHFHSTKAGTENPIPAKVEATPSQKNGTVARWDVTVADDQHEIKHGRTFAYYLSLNSGANFLDSNNRSNSVISDTSIYVVTNDSYVYKVDFNSINPWGYIFFANTRGLCTAGANSTPIYHSVSTALNNMSSLQSDCLVDFNSPSSPDTALDKTFKLFFEEPSSELQGILFDRPELPSAVTDLKFHGARNENTTYEGEGGRFTFYVESGSSVQIKMDFSNGTDSDNPAKTVTVSNTVTPGENTFYWDGRYDDGSLVEAGVYDLSSIIITSVSKSGEIHFPTLDVEALEDITITRMNGTQEDTGVITKTGEPANNSVIYYNNLPLTNAVSNASQTKQKAGTFTGEGSVLYDKYKLPDGTYTMGLMTGIANPDMSLGINSDSTNSIMNLKYSTINTGGNMAAIDIWTYYQGERLQQEFKQITNLIVEPDPENKKTITGVVFFDAGNDGGRFLRSNGDYGLSNMLIDLVNADGEVVDSTRSDIDGTYFFYTVPYGTYTIVPHLNSVVYTNTTKNAPQTFINNGTNSPDDMGYYHGEDGKDITIQKRWADNIATEDSVTIKLFFVYTDAQGEEQVIEKQTPLILSKENHWKGTFDALPATIDGSPAACYIEEYYTRNGEEIFIGQSQILGDLETPLFVPELPMLGEPNYTATFHWSNLSATEYLMTVTNTPPADYAVTFHSNIKGVADVFKVFAPQADSYYKYTDLLQPDKTIAEFTDIPILNEATAYTNNAYIFAGWYYGNGKPLKWDSDTFLTNTDVYAHWVKTDTVSKDPADTKLTGSSSYSGFDLFGVQVRADKYEKPGLRFVTSYSNTLIQSLNTLFTTPYTSAAKTYNAQALKYGYALAKTQTVQNYLAANGIDASTFQLTTDTYGAQDVDCTKSLAGNNADHRNYKDYRLSSLVVTYSDEGKTPQQLALAKATPVVARAYIKYTDANGIFRTVYNNYTGTKTFSGCSTDYTTVWNRVSNNPDQDVTG